MSYYGYERNSGIPRITGYADALARWENTKPIRGRENQNMRPLGFRNRTYAIARDEQTQDIVAYLWREHEVVRYKPNGDVVISAGEYITTSLTNFLSDVFGRYDLNAQVFDHSYVLTLRGQDARCRLSRNQTITIRRGEDKNYHYVDGNNTHHTALRRKEMNAVRKKVADFMKYAIGMCKLQEGVFNVDESKEYISLRYRQSDTETFTNGMTLTMQRILNTDENTKYEGWSEALYAIANSYGAYNRNWGATPTRLLSAWLLIKSVDSILIGTHRDTVLERVPVTGSVTRDKYKDYFNDPRWNAYHASKE